jgi:short-subunit dehydrogenase
VAAALGAHGRLDVLVNAAGVITRADAEGTTDEEWHRVMSTNVDGLFRTSRAALPAIRAAGGGAIINISSTNGLVGGAGLAAYCASKFGLRGFTEALRRELADTPVQVIYVAPRATATDMNPEAVNELNRALGNAMDAPEAVASQILAAMENDDRRRFLGWPEKLFVVINGILPRIVDKAMLKQLPVIRRFLNPGVLS